MNKIFGDGYAIYVDDIEQGLEEPCFYIAYMGGSSTLFLGNRAKQTNMFDVHFFPKEKMKSNILKIAEQLTMGLSNIQLLDHTNVYGTEIHYQIVENVLHFFISYNLVILHDTKERRKEKFEGINIKTELKE